MVIASTNQNNSSSAINQVETILAAAKERTISKSIMSQQQPPASTSSTAFFPSSQATPDHANANANAMLAARKQQLAHLQTLQRQQQQVLQQMSHKSAAAAQGDAPSSPLQAYAQDGRDDRFSASGLRSHNASPMGASSVVSFHQNQFASSQRSVTGSVTPRRPAFECDYDTNPTELYLSVQRKDWDGAVERAATCPHEASTWVSRKEADGKLRWRLLPLHAAIIFRAPERTVSALLFAFAQGAACKDDQGMLPLHLAFRNGCDEGVVHLLLMAYPQSVDVQDRKGRTPMVLAQQSTHANREAYVRALERGPAYYAVANAAKDGIVNSPGMMTQHQVPPMPPAGYGASYSQSLVAALQSQHAPSQAGSVVSSSVAAPVLPVLTSEARAIGGDRHTELEAELAKTQETSQVLVDHVNSLEAQLASRSDTERFLATKIANLDSQLKEAHAKLEASAAEIEAKNVEISKKDEEVDERTKAAETEVADLKVALADKKEAELKSYKLTNRERFDLEERVETSERDCAAAQANAAVLEAQLKKKIETEQSLASQVSMLASQLASSASSSGEAASAYQRKCELLTADNTKLQSHIEELEGKLGTVATALDSMAAEQERIVEAATKHEKTMAACAKAHQSIIHDTTRQETLLEDAAKEREQIVSILMRQAEDAERTMSDREKVLEAVKVQEKDITLAAQERDSVVGSVNKQREYMDFMLNGELNFLKRTTSEDACNLVNENKRNQMEEKLQEYMNERPKEVEEVKIAQEAAAADEVIDQAAVVAAAFGKSANVEEEAETIEDIASEEPSSDVVAEDPHLVETEEATNVVEEETVEEEVADDEKTSDEAAEDAALEEAVHAVKEAMKAAESAIEQGADDEEEEEEADDESDDGESSADEASVASEAEADDEVEEEASPAEDAGYETPASQEEDEEEEDDEDAAIDVAVSAASRDEEEDEESVVNSPVNSPVN